MSPSWDRWTLLETQHPKSLGRKEAKKKSHSSLLRKDGLYMSL